MPAQAAGPAAYEGLLDDPRQAFFGYLTLELSNVANLPITIYPGMKIGQISFFRLSTAADRPYGSKDRGSKYQGQRGPTASRFFEEFQRSGGEGNGAAPASREAETSR